jgi:hypothetical protein
MGFSFRAIIMELETVQEILKDFSSITLDTKDYLVYELGPYLELQYNKKDKKYCLWYISENDLEEYEESLNPNTPFPFTIINTICISQEDFNDFIAIVNKEEGGSK